MLSITGGYAGVLALFFVFLSARVITYRRGNSISLGDAGDKILLSRMRAQGNFAEYAPFALLLIGIAELQGTGSFWLHTCGLLLVVGRVMHGINFTYRLGQMGLRVGGMALTLTAISLGAVHALPF